MLSVSIVSPYNAREATVATWTFGDATVTRLEEQVGFASLPPEKFLDGFDRKLLARHLDWLVPHHFSVADDRLVTSIHSWLIRTRRHTILLDSCAGNHKNRPGFARFHQLDTPFLQRLRAAGVHPEEIDIVLCTHLHADHVGWNTQLVDGRWVPTFPNARYLFAKREYVHWEAERTKQGEGKVNDGSFDDSVLPVVEAGRAVMVDVDHQPDPLLTLKDYPGHTPGSIAINLKDGDRRACFSGDIMHHPIQVYYPDWSSQFCWDQEMSARSRRRLLEDCVESNALLCPAHFPGANAGYIKR